MRAMGADLSRCEIFGRIWQIPARSDAKMQHVYLRTGYPRLNFSCLTERPQDLLTGLFITKLFRLNRLLVKPERRNPASSINRGFAGVLASVLISFEFTNYAILFFSKSFRLCADETILLQLNRHKCVIKLTPVIVLLLFWPDTRRRNRSSSRPFFSGRWSETCFCASKPRFCEEQGRSFSFLP